MLFEHTVPLAAGYFQCDLSTTRFTRDSARHGGLLYIASGNGEWTLGDWKFPCRRGDLFSVPLELKLSADLRSDRPLAYYYCYFELENNATDYALNWPWKLGQEPSQESGHESAQEKNYSRMAPCAGGAFRPELAANFRAIQYELSHKTLAGLIAAKAHLTILGINFARMLDLKSRGVEPSSNGGGLLPMGKGLPESVACVVDYVQAHLAKDLSVAELASVARCSERRLVDVFRNAVGTSPMDYVRERRVFEAQKLLVLGLAIKDVANRLNFADSHHFSRVFRQKTGITPSEYAAGKAPLRQRFVGEYTARGAEF